MSEFTTKTVKGGAVVATNRYHEHYCAFPGQPNVMRKYAVLYKRYGIHFALFAPTPRALLELQQAVGDICAYDGPKDLYNVAWGTIVHDIETGKPSFVAFWNDLSQSH